MAVPTDAVELCDVLGVSPLDLVFPCLYCNSDLGFAGAVLYYDYKFIPLLRDGCFYGVCCACIGILSYIERTLYTCGSASAEYIEAAEHQCIFDLLLRCQFCYKPLSDSDKACMIDLGENFVRIRDFWRGICLFCRVAE